MFGSPGRRRGIGRYLALSLAAALAVSTGTVQAAGEEPLTGSWRGTLTGGGSTEQALWLFTADGGVILQPAEGLSTDGVGGWVRTSDGYRVSVLAFLEGEQGTLAIDQLIVIDANGGRFTSSGTATDSELDGTVRDTVEVTGEAFRLAVAGAEAVSGLDPLVITAAGADADAIRPAVDEYKALFGEDHVGEPGSRESGFRTITWDGTPAEQSAPNGYAPDFFNAPTAPRSRGAVFDAPAGSLMVSASRDGTPRVPPRFGNINIQYASEFKAFSGEKLFSPVGTNVAELLFFVPGTDTPAVVSGFGAVYLDVDTEHTAFEYFGIDGEFLGAYAVPPADKGFSFLGVAFDEPIVHRVRITYGTAVLGAEDAPGNDVAVMDDFIYGEPQAAE
jgi:hypothetical protein